MKRDTYMSMVLDELPELYKVVSLNIVCHCMADVIKMVAKELFILDICNSPLADETRKQMINLHEKGVTCFE